MLFRSFVDSSPLPTLLDIVPSPFATFATSISHTLFLSPPPPRPLPRFISPSLYTYPLPIMPRFLLLLMPTLLAPYVGIY